MFRWWAFWRRVQYLTGFSVLLGIFGVILYYSYWYVAPTCFDGIQNGTEAGIDCGGSCERICEFTVVEPSALWVKSFRVAEGQYNAVAYVENRNKNSGIKELGYTIRLFDDTGEILSREGVTAFPPDGVYPIFEGRLMTGDRVPTKTEITFDPHPLWIPAEKGRDRFVLEKRDLVSADTKPRLSAQLRNTTLDPINDVEIIATIFDVSGNPLTASKTSVERFPGRAAVNVVFTWPEPISGTLRSCEIPTDVLLGIDLSGSMNDDKKDPPEPISSVLTAAQSFVSRLNKQDQVGVVTYATRASTSNELTSDIASVKDAIVQLTISPKEEKGSTNTGDALELMTKEFNSRRHNESARKVAILLTDGLATAPKENPETYAEEKASLLKKLNVQLFTIGLGEKVNEDFLKRIATKESSFYKAPTTRELEGIYTSITKDICEDGPAVIEVVAKPNVLSLPSNNKANPTE